MNPTSAPAPLITRADPAQAPRLARLLTDAFLAGPLADWLVPDLAERQRVYLRYWARIAGHALHGAAAHVEVIGAEGGAALWYRAGPGTPQITPTGYDEDLTRVCGPAAPRFRLLDEAMHDALPAEFTGGFDYCGFLAVAPSFQRRGWGRALMNYRHAALDAERRYAVLIASSHDSARLYRRLGYEFYGPAIRPAPGAPQLYPMVREPAGLD